MTTHVILTTAICYINTRDQAKLKGDNRKKVMIKHMHGHETISEMRIENLCYKFNQQTNTMKTSA
jgi:hypothetical protein